jgi:hypothetical protein
MKARMDQKLSRKTAVKPGEVALTTLRIMTIEESAQLAKMLSNPVTPEEFKDWFDNTAALIARWKSVDQTDHQTMRQAWNRIGANVRESQKLLGAFGDLSNVAPLEMQNLKFVHEFLEARSSLLDGLESIEKWAGTYLTFLEGQAHEHLGGREPWKQWGYVAVIQFWVSRGGKPSKSASGPLARFLTAVSESLFGGAPESSTIPGIVERAKRELKIV